MITEFHVGFAVRFAQRNPSRPPSPLFPYTTLFRSYRVLRDHPPVAWQDEPEVLGWPAGPGRPAQYLGLVLPGHGGVVAQHAVRSEERRVGKEGRRRARRVPLSETHGEPHVELGDHGLDVSRGAVALAHC